MSGHAGFQVIANRPQPVNGGMHVDDVNAPDKASSRELHSETNPVKPVGGYKLPSDGDIVRKAKHQVRSIFVRDIIGGVAKEGWFV